uniref:Alkyldihydroxyacetonephosphate synthase-like protein n=1 Tax=Triatoma infestans TaxID=30076 RepID=A0A171B2R6_TRIIF
MLTFVIAYIRVINFRFFKYFCFTIV